MNRVTGVLGGIVCASLFACGGAPPPPPVETPSEPEPVHAAPPPIQATQELGSIDERATNHTFEGLQSQLLDCQKQGIQRIEFLAGDARFFVRIAGDGSVRWAYLEDSTIGDRETEKCMLQVVTSARWPKPDGGEAEVQKSIGFDVADARPPAAWSSEKVSSVLAREGSDALQCKGKIRGAFKVTVYVEPADASSSSWSSVSSDAQAKGHAKKRKNASGQGKVIAVGVAPPNKDGEAKVDCIVDAVKAWKMPSPGSYAAKVTFSL